MNNETAQTIRKSLKADCSQCFGLCCTALHIVVSSDFALNKPAETPCPNLQKDYRCSIHNKLRDSGFKGCTVFDCLGAGQKVSQDIYNGQSWREHPNIATNMFHVFSVVEKLYAMIAFVAEALTYPISDSLRTQLSEQLERLQGLIDLDADRLLTLDIRSCQLPVNALLLETSEYIRREWSSKVFMIKIGKACRGVDWIGKNVAGKDLRTTDLRGAYLIATDLRNTDLRGVDFIGADLRDADLRGANLSTSMFLTQMQINSAKGNEKTILPTHIQRPSHWMN